MKETQSNSISTGNNFDRKLFDVHRKNELN